MAIFYPNSLIFQKACLALFRCGVLGHLCSFPLCLLGLDLFFMTGYLFLLTLIFQKCCEENVSEIFNFLLLCFIYSFIYSFIHYWFGLWVAAVHSHICSLKLEFFQKLHCKPVMDELNLTSRLEWLMPSTAADTPGCIYSKNIVECAI